MRNLIVVLMVLCVTAANSYAAVPAFTSVDELNGASATDDFYFADENAASDVLTLVAAAAALTKP